MSNYKVISRLQNYGARAQNVTNIEYCPSSLFTLSHQPLYIWKICIHTHISDCVGTVYVLPLLSNKCCQKIFLYKSGAVGRSDWICLTGVQARRWASTWHWIKHFTVSATNRWPKCPNKNQMSLPFTVRRQFQYSENDNWKVGGTEYFFSHSDFHFFVSEQLIHFDKHP